jgi:hypothetical protein
LQVGVSDAAQSDDANAPIRPRHLSASFVLLLAPIYFACRAELLLASVVRRRKRRGKKDALSPSHAEGEKGRKERSKSALVTFWGSQRTEAFSEVTFVPMGEKGGCLESLGADSHFSRGYFCRG